jgi:CBS domain containing-hemolysin-like protein
LIFISVALGFSFLCSVLEAVLLSTSHSHIEVLSSQDSRPAQLMRSHKEEVEKPISAILTLNTIAHTVGAAGAGAQAAAVFGSQWLGLASAVLTLLILIFSEILPKTIGAVYWKQLMPFSAYAIQALVVIFYPAVWAGQRFTQMLTPNEHQPTVTRSELAAMARIGAGEGQIEESEFTIFRNLLRLNALRAGDIMTPRTVMLTFQEDMTVDEVLDRQKEINYSRLPVYNESVDDITGFVLRHDIVRAAAEGKGGQPLTAFKRPLEHVPEMISAAQALEAFIQQGEHIFVVFDEYGGTEGILTLEDTIEALLGHEITDESDLVADLRELAQHMYETRQEEADERKPTVIAPPLTERGKNTGPSGAAANL